MRMRATASLSRLPRFAKHPRAIPRETSLGHGVRSCCLVDKALHARSPRERRSRDRPAVLRVGRGFPPIPVVHLLGGHHHILHSSVVARTSDFHAWGRRLREALDSTHPLGARFSSGVVSAEMAAYFSLADGDGVLVHRGCAGLARERQESPKSRPLVEGSAEVACSVQRQGRPGQCRLVARAALRYGCATSGPFSPALDGDAGKRLRQGPCPKKERACTPWAQELAVWSRGRYCCCLVYRYPKQSTMNIRMPLSDSRCQLGSLASPQVLTRVRPAQALPRSPSDLFRCRGYSFGFGVA